MVEVVVNDKQAQQIESADCVIYLRDSRGKLLGQVTPVATSLKFSREEITELEKRLDLPGARRTMQEVNDDLEERYGT